MAGHSHWTQIKRAKAVTDKRRGRVWSKLSRAIIVAARAGGGDPDTNLALRYAIDGAREENMPRDTIERAIKKGTGELEGAQYEELTYEGYAPGGVAILLHVLTDNRTRTAGEVRNIFEKGGGNMGASGSVGWMFAKRGVLLINATAADEETLTDIALAAGADDVRGAGEVFEMTCEPAAFIAVRQALADAKIATESASLTMEPSTRVAVTGEVLDKVLKLIDTLEENDDVQNVYNNLEMSDADASRLSG